MFYTLTECVWRIGRAYARGYWTCPVPPVCTARWTDASWIKHIGLQQLARLGMNTVPRIGEGAQ